eukprot:SAG11_NODE_5606_length_1510_cov_1.570517_2_plen_161_part_01
MARFPREWIIRFPKPSVVAAVSGAAKLVASDGGGFETAAERAIMTGQMQLVGFANAAGGLGEDDRGRAAVLAAAAAVRKAKGDLVAKANAEYCGSMHARGGGVLDLEPRVLQSQNPQIGWQFVAHVRVDVCDAMGANLVNTIVERLAPDVLAIVQQGAATH